MLSAPIWKDNPHELLMDESKVYMKEGMNYITEEEWHCEEQTVKIYSWRGDKMQISYVKVQTQDIADRAPETKGLPAAHPPGRERQLLRIS